MLSWNWYISKTTLRPNEAILSVSELLQWLITIATGFTHIYLHNNYVRNHFIIINKYIDIVIIVMILKILVDTFEVKDEPCIHALKIMQDISC